MFFISAVVEVEKLREIKKEQIVDFYKVSLANINRLVPDVYWKVRH